MASGNTLIACPADDGDQPASNYARWIRRTDQWVAAFNDTTDQTLIFRNLIMPRHYAAGGVTLSLRWAAATAVTGTVRWECSFARKADADTQTDDIDTDTFATAKTTGGAAPTGNAGQFQYTDIAFTNGSEIDGVLVGEMFDLKITRDANGTSGTDDMVGDAQLVSWELRET